MAEAALGQSSAAGLLSRLPCPAGAASSRRASGEAAACGGVPRTADRAGASNRPGVGPGRAAVAAGLSAGARLPRTERRGHEGSADVGSPESTPGGAVAVTAASHGDAEATGSWPAAAAWPRPDAEPAPAPAPALAPPDATCAASAASSAAFAARACLASIAVAATAGSTMQASSGGADASAASASASPSLYSMRAAAVASASAAARRDESARNASDTAGLRKRATVLGGRATDPSIPPPAASAASTNAPPPYAAAAAPLTGVTSMGTPKPAAAATHTDGYGTASGRGAGRAPDPARRMIQAAVPSAADGPPS
mmetsp:Transcript_18577/g.70512  ORF Transcript_18577/g.70512 Transcript_18577/m.70512 type:complete len:313 (-) Transcript_18577:266-1204(-)